MFEEQSLLSDRPEATRSTEDKSLNIENGSGFVNGNANGIKMKGFDETIDLATLDSGNELLYPESGKKLPMKTSDRLLDDLLCDIEVMDREKQSFSMLNSETLNYAKIRYSLKPNSLGFIQDQVIIQTKYEYTSRTCPSHNKIDVLLGVLVDTKLLQELERKAFEEITDIPIHHVKISIKTRGSLETNKKLVGVSRYHRIDKLHEFDRLDLMTYDPNDEQLVDSSIYVSEDTNRLILIEIFKPEFSPNDKDVSLSRNDIKIRYMKASERFPELSPENAPTQLECINTLFKIFKGPLVRKSEDEPLKTINADNILLNSNMNPSALVSHFSFTLSEEEVNDERNVKRLIREYEPPNLIDYKANWKVRKLREAFTRKCLELVTYGNLIISSLSSDYLKDPQFVKKFRLLHALQPEFTLFPWLQILSDFKTRNIELMSVGHEKGYHLQEAQTRVYYSPLDCDSHFINLSVCYHYTDRDIIQNYEKLLSLDERNAGIYFDSLNLVANRKGSYQLISYCGRQDIIGQEALQNSLAVFGIDYREASLSSIDESLLLSIYKHEWKTNMDNNRIRDLKNALRLLAKYLKSDYLKFYIDHEPYRNIQQAYDVLEIDESVDDDIIQTAYTVKINDSPGLKIDCDRGLFTIASVKRSLMLYNFLFDQCPEFQTYYGPNRYSYQQALNVLQVNENAPDSTLLNIFQQKWSQSPISEPDQLLNIKSALMKIGLERNSKLVINYLETGTIDPNCLPAENWPMGINNIGNTCYLNSLLQYYFSISPLREYITEYQQTLNNFNAQNNENVSKRRIGGREVGKNEIERSIQFLYQLRDLYNTMMHSSERCVTPRRELAYLAFAPSNTDVEFEAQETLKDRQETDNIEKMEVDSSETPDFRGKMENNDNGVDIEMKDEKSISSEIKKDDGNAETKIAKIDPEQLENALELGRQQDVTECIGNVLFQLESSSYPDSLSEDNEQNDLIKDLFFGETNQIIKPLNSSSTPRSKIERFLSLLVNIADHPKDIYDALDVYFKDEFLTMEEYGEVKRELAIRTFPTILQIQIQRVYYDRERFMPFKSIEPLPFDTEIYLDRYAETDNALLLEKKNQAELLKAKLNKLRERQSELLFRNELGLSRKDAYKETSNFLRSGVLMQSGIEFEQANNAAHLLDEASGRVSEELSTIYLEISDLEDRIAHQFDDFKEHGYTLFAVFIHRGEASYGHYWVYIKDYANNIWRKYNDETVTEVPEEEVMNFTEGNTATPYFIVFVKKGHENDIEPLKRIIAP
ncbi:Ubiquitin carboxyl-terminal hydrolase 2 [Nakaseomyces bracarensis]|uniref:ubiquitinyl hydrolase 1 n=1 Tax=Nakaseomyces bracarensis TaxID=273131 RepID=A0ABR4NUB8_9SACH